MTPTTLSAATFGQQKPRKSRMLAGGILMAAAFLAFFLNLFYGPDLPSPNLKPNTVELICRQVHGTDTCEAIGDIRVHGKSSTIFVVSTQGGTVETWNVPYAMNNLHIMRFVRTITIKKSPSSSEIPECSKNFSVPAIVFSTAVEYDNHFHDMNDIVSPLYSTSAEFNGEVQFVLSDLRPSWAIKFKEVLQKLSKFDLVEMDTRSDQVLCFPRIIIGLKDYKGSSIRTSNSPNSRKDFVKFLRSVYSLKRHQISADMPRGMIESYRTNELEDHEYVQRHNNRVRPRLLVISREKTRRFLNAEEIARTAEEIGFQVVVNETGGNLMEVAQFVNSFDALMGIHGAGLSNMVFLPENALVIQIVPWGLNYFSATTLFGIPAEDMDLRYLDYTIRPNESSLSQQYSLEHQVFTDIQPVYKKGTDYFWPIYLEQDIRLDVDSCFVTLSKAYQLLHT